MELQQNKSDVSGFTLKMIAVVTMLIDHIGAAILEGGLAGKYNSNTLWMIDQVLRDIGRLAFPLFCFFIVEGFHYTHDRKKYALRLGIFAVISEVPFDMAFDHSFFAPSDNSVMITLLLGLISIWVIDILLKKSAARFSSDIRKRRICDALSVIAVIVCVYIIEEWASSDYGAAGVITIIIMYLMYDKRQLGFALAIIWLGFTCGRTELIAAVDLIPLYFYHGRQGRKMKYFFYAFYPAHLLVLSLIAKAAGLWAYQM